MSKCGFDFPDCVNKSSEDVGQQRARGRGVEGNGRSRGKDKANSGGVSRLLR